MSYPLDFGPLVPTLRLVTPTSEPWATSAFVQLAFPDATSLAYKTDVGSGTLTSTADDIAAIRAAYEATWLATDWTPAVWAAGAVAAAWVFAWIAARKLGRRKR